MESPRGRSRPLQHGPVAQHLTESPLSRDDLMNAPVRSRPRTRKRSPRRQWRPGRIAIEGLEDRVVPTLLGQQLFPSNNPWNQPIASAPVASNSAAIMSNIISLYGNGHTHPD